MNVFDDEAGPLCPQDEAERLLELALAGLNMQELAAWLRLTGNESVN